MRRLITPTATTRCAAAVALSVFAVVLAAPAVGADVTAVFEAPSGAVTVEYRDDRHVRLRAADNPYFVLREGKGYMVNREGEQWQVIAMDDMAGIMNAARAGSDTKHESAAREEGNYRLKDTGRTETLAGIRGQVYEYAERDRRTGEWSASEEIVLSDDAGARAAYRGLMRVTDLMGAMIGAQGLDGHPGAPPGLENKAVLRYGNAWRLSRLHADPIPDRHFALPAEPMAMPGAPAAGSPHAADSDPSNWAAEEARELGRTAAEEARQEARRGVSDNARKGVRDGMRGLFGR